MNAQTGQLESVAILGWGSLIWNPPDSYLTEADRLKMPGCWHSDGPMLPLEFSRVAGDGHLRLVIDPVHGRNCRVFYTLSGHSSVTETIKHLQVWEGLPSAEVVHFVHRDDTPDDLARASVVSWLKEHHFDAAVWVGLGNNFQEKTGKPFTVENALEYLDTLRGEARDAALSYIAKVPESMDTMVRLKLRSLFATEQA
jgi:cation transport regulator ChaC